MPFFKVPGIGVMHVKMGGRKRHLAPCAAVVGFHSEAGEQEQCHQWSEFLCDWATMPGRTCDAPLCESHAREVGKNRHFCPEHFAAHTHQQPQRGLFDGLLNEVSE